MTSIAASSKTVEDGLRPARSCACQLEHRAGAVGAAEQSRAVQVAGAVENYVTEYRSSSITASREAIEHGLRPGAEHGFAGGRWRLQAENRATPRPVAAISPCMRGRAIEDALRPEYYSGVGVGAVVAPSKVVEGVKGPAGPYFR